MPATRDPGQSGGGRVDAMKKMLLDIEEVMSLLGVDRPEIARLIKDENLPAVRLRAQIKIHAREFEAWFASFVEHSRAAAVSRDTLLELVAAPAPQAPDTIPEATEPEKVFSVMDVDLDAPPVTLCGAFSLGVFNEQVRVRVEPGVELDSGMFEALRGVFEDFQFGPVDLDALKSMLRKKRGEWIAAASVSADRFSSVNVVVSRDRQRAYLMVFPDRVTRGVTLSQVRAALDRCGVLPRADMPLATHILHNGLFGQAALIARGVESSPGSDAHLQFHFCTEKAMTPRMLDNGDVDFKNLENIPLAAEGDVLVTRVPATPGADGVDVCGRPVPARAGRDVRIRAGANTRLSDDGSCLIAAARGHVVLDGDKVHVEHVFYVDRDVDYSVGNIDFTGAVVVTGSVREGFAVKARGDIRVLGSVEGARLESTEGSVFVRLGVQGRNRAELLAAGHVRAKFINQTSVRAGGDVRVSESIMHSDVCAGGSVLAHGSKGCIIGGVVRARNTIVATEIGSRVNSRTTLIIEYTDEQTGLPLRNMLKDRARTALIGRANARRAALSRSRNSASTAVALRAPELEQWDREADALKEQITAFHKSLGPRGTRFIRALGLMHPQVTVILEGRTHTFPQGAHHCTVRLDDEQHLFVQG